MRTNKTLDEYIELVGRLGGVFLASNWLCPRCLGTYRSKRDETVCGCGVEGVSVSKELVDVVRGLIKLGLVVVYADCATYSEYAGESITRIDIGLGDGYAAEMFDELPTGWETFDYSPINTEFGTMYTGLVGLCRHPNNNLEHLGLSSLDKDLCIKDLEVWLESRDGAGFKSVLVLGGYKDGC